MVKMLATCFSTAPPETTRSAAIAELDRPSAISASTCRSRGVSVASRQRGGLATLTPRERQVLALMAEGRSNSAIAAELIVSGGAIEKHVASIFTKLGLPPDESDNRRVLAVLHYLRSPV